MPNDPEKFQRDDEDTQDKDTDLWSAIGGIIDAAGAVAEDAEREERIAKWEPGSFEPHDIFALQNQLQVNSEEYERQIEEVSVTLIRPFERLVELVKQYGGQYQNPETLELKELRIEITQQWHAVVNLVTGPPMAPRGELVPALSGYSNPDRAANYEELIHEQREQMLQEAGQLRIDNHELAQQWEFSLREINTREAQFKRLKELMRARLDELQSELSVEQVLAVTKETYNEFDDQLDKPARNVVDTLIYNDLLRDLIQDFA